MPHTNDYLLNKRIKIFQPIDGYRASTDAVLLSSVVSIKKNDTILDVGSGTGAISLCLAERLKSQNPKIIGLEMQEELCNLSNQSAEANSFDYLSFINCDIRKTKITEQFAHVITNPPYSEDDMPSPNESKATAHNHQDFSLKSWLDFCIKRIKPRGFFYIINRAEHIEDILKNISGKLGNITILPIYSKSGQNAKRVIIIAQKDSKASAKILEGFVVHDENGQYGPKAESILREGKGYF